MRKQLLSIAFAGVVLFCAPITAFAQPVLAGKYAYTYDSLCQVGAAGFPEGWVYKEVDVAQFHHGTSMLNLTGIGIGAPLTTAVAVPKNFPINLNFPYSNTATTLTIGSLTYNAVYGPVISGTTTAQALFISAILGDCVTGASLIHE